MGRGVGSIWCLVVLIPGLLPGCWSQGSPRVVIDGYRHNGTLTSGDSVPLGTQIILVCRVVGLPYGTPLKYTWTCPNGLCEVEGYYGRKIHNEHILAVNTTSTRDGGIYTCQMAATGGQEATGSFTLTVTGGNVAHSYGRLIPHEFPITDLQQISGPDGIGRINCTVSSGTAKFGANGGTVAGRGVSEIRHGATVTLVVNTSNIASFQNKLLFCAKIDTNFFYLFISNANLLSAPSFVLETSALGYRARKSDDLTNAYITGYEVIRFGIPMIGEYANAAGGKFKISPELPGVQYRITALAFKSNITRSALAVKQVSTAPAVPSPPRNVTITRVFQEGVELNWLPPTDPNGEVHYVIYYTPEGGTEQSINTESDLTHYNLTGLERNRVYINIAVQGVNGGRRSGRSAVIQEYNHTPPNEDTPSTGSPTSTGLPRTNTQVTGSLAPHGPPRSAALTAGVVVALLLVVLLLLVGGVVTVVVIVKRKRKWEASQSHSKALEASMHEGKGTKDDINMYQNVQHNPASAPKCNEPYYSTPADNFVNPASATAYFNANLYDSADYSKEDHKALDADAEELYEEARADELSWGGGGYKKPVKSASEAQTASALLAKKGYELMHPEELYTQPDKITKMKKDNQGSKIEETPAPVEDLYTIPDMTKKMKPKNQKGLEQESEERKLPPQAPLPYKKHKEAKEEGEEDVPELPPAYDFDGEQDCDTGDGDGDGSERRFEYAVLEWQKK